MLLFNTHGHKRSAKSKLHPQPPEERLSYSSQEKLLFINQFVKTCYIKLSK